MNFPKHPHKDNAFDKIARQKQEALRNIRRERDLMAQYGDALLKPLQQPQELLAAHPFRQITRTVSGAAYAIKVARGIFSIIKHIR
ncbi:MAG: hypothetical protein ILA34_06595 [Bacteroidaceae bacterium]|nr:hypothetical protein [Bacteroidaceae bacterium]